MARKGDRRGDRKGDDRKGRKPYARTAQHELPTEETDVLADDIEAAVGDVSPQRAAFSWAVCFGGLLTLAGVGALAVGLLVIRDGQADGAPLAPRVTSVFEAPATTSPAKQVLVPATAAPETTATRTPPLQAARQSPLQLQTAPSQAVPSELSPPPPPQAPSLSVVPPLSPLPMAPPPPRAPQPPPPTHPPPLHSPPPSGPRSNACLSQLSATGVQPGHATTQLWVYEGQGNYETLRKTAEQPGVDPQWDETFCVSLAERDDPRTCFDVRDGQQLVHFGCTTLAPPWDTEPKTVSIDHGATIRFAVLPPPPPLPPSPPARPPPPFNPPGVCVHSWCDEFQSWIDDHHSKFHRMWGRAWAWKEPFEDGCWAGLGGREWLAKAWDGTWCDRNWMSGSAAPMQNDRPSFSEPAPALLGFDETILGYCSHLVGLDFDGGDLNTELAERCVRANKNVLRLLSGGRPWDMCQNIEWQFCAINGQLPGQDARKVSFASAPKDVELVWWTDPGTHPTYTPRWDGYALGDVYFAEMCVFFALCRNRHQLFQLEVGETMECDKDQDGFEHLVDMFLSHE